MLHEHELFGWQERAFPRFISCLPSERELESYTQAADQSLTNYLAKLPCLESLESRPSSVSSAVKRLQL